MQNNNKNKSLCIKIDYTVEIDIEFKYVQVNRSTNHYSTSAVCGKGVHEQ